MTHSKRGYTTAHACATHPEGALGDVDSSPADDDGVLDGLGGNIDAREGAVTLLLDLNINGAALCILEGKDLTSDKATFPGLRDWEGRGIQH